MDAAQTAALKAELTLDPLTYGYMVAWGASEPEVVAALINKVRDGTDGEAAITINRGDVDPREILEAIDVRDFIASPNALATAWFQSVTQLPLIRLANTDGTKSVTRQNLDRAVTNGQGSQGRLDAIAVRRGSRAEQLFGADTLISVQDVTTAMRS